MTRVTTSDGLVLAFTIFRKKLKKYCGELMLEGTGNVLEET